MKCPNCSEDVEASAVFCGNCGHQQQAAPAPVAPPTTPAPVPGAQAPAYAVGRPKASKDSKILTWAVVLAVLSVPGAIIPLIGLALSVTAIIMASKHHHAGTGRVAVASVFGCIGVLLSLAAWNYNVVHSDDTGFMPRTMTAALAIQYDPAAYTAFVTLRR